MLFSRIFSSQKKPYLTFVSYHFFRVSNRLLVIYFAFKLARFVSCKDLFGASLSLVTLVKSFIEHNIIRFQYSIFILQCFAIKISRLFRELQLVLYEQQATCVYSQLIIWQLLSNLRQKLILHNTVFQSWCISFC